MEVRPDHEERWQDGHRPKIARGDRPEQHDEDREARDTKELRPVRPEIAGERDRRDRDERREQRPLRDLADGGVRDRRRERSHRDPAEDDDPEPAAERVSDVERELTEPLVGEDGMTGHRPREVVDARQTGGSDVAADREMPEEIAVRRRRPRGDERRGRADEKGNAERACRHGRARSTKFAPSARTRQPSSRSATTSGRDGRRRISAMS